MLMSRVPQQVGNETILYKYLIYFNFIPYLVSSEFYYFSQERVRKKKSINFLSRDIYFIRSFDMVCIQRKYENSARTKSKSNLFVRNFRFISEDMISRARRQSLQIYYNKNLNTPQWGKGAPKVTNYIWKL